MPTSNDGVMVILSSPSGAGKTTLVNLLSNQDNFKVSIKLRDSFCRHKRLISSDKITFF